MTLKENDDIFIRACENNDIKKVRKMLKKGLNNKLVIYEGVDSSCKAGFLEITKMLIEDQGFKYFIHYASILENVCLEAVIKGHKDIVEYILNNQFVENDNLPQKIMECACEKGHLNIMQYIINSKFNYDINADSLGRHYENITMLGIAVICRYFHIVQYLLTSPELKITADIHAGSTSPISIACSISDVELAKYLLTSPDLKEHASLHHKNDNILMHALDIYDFEGKKKSLETREKMLSFLIFDCNIDEPLSLEKDIIETNKEQSSSERVDVKKMFVIRENYQTLSEELNNGTNENTYKNKMKI